MKRLAIVVALAIGACAPADPETGDRPMVRPAIAAAVEATMPGVTITGGDQDREGEYEVTGTLDGQEYEFDLLGPNGGWRVVEIQRDIAWADAPEAVRTAAAAAPAAFAPVRVIESRQPADGSVVYELFREEEARRPAMEVRLLDGEAAVMPAAH